jgi:hypothetical protein
VRRNRRSVRGSGGGPVGHHGVQDGECVPGDARGDRQSAWHDEGGLAGSGGVAGVVEPAEIDFVAVPGGLPPGKQWPVRARRDSLKGEALAFGEVQQLFRGSQLRVPAVAFTPESPNQVEPGSHRLVLALAADALP